MGKDKSGMAISTLKRSQVTLSVVPLISALLVRSRQAVSIAGVLCG